MAAARDRGPRPAPARPVPAWLPFLILLSALASGIRPARASGPVPSGPDREHRVKAVFLFNFAQFVEWPENVFAGPKDPLVIGVLGENPFDEFLDEVVKGESVREHPIVVMRFKRVEDIKECHVLFIGSGEAGRLDGDVAALKARKILTVGESRDFLAHGGMVLFVNEGGRVRFKINLDAVQEADLSVSSKLLRLADISGTAKE
jgi:YfiR/HmsC-like